MNTGNGALYRKTMEKFMQEYPDDRDGYFYAGLGAEYLEKNCEYALLQFEKAYALTPNYYPITKAIVTTVEARAFPNAMSGLPSSAAIPLTRSSGKADRVDTNKAPKTNRLRPIRPEIRVALSVMNFAP